eukprot:507514_1
MLDLVSNLILTMVLSFIGNPILIISFLSSNLILIVFLLAIMNMKDQFQQQPMKDYAFKMIVEAAHRVINAPDRLPFVSEIVEKETEQYWSNISLGCNVSPSTKFTSNTVSLTPT